jgi:hypothetical protein
MVMLEEISYVSMVIFGCSFKITTDMNCGDISATLGKEINDRYVTCIGCEAKSITDIVSSDISASLEKEIDSESVFSV